MKTIKHFLIGLLVLLTLCSVSQSIIGIDPEKPMYGKVGYVQASDPDGDLLQYRIANQEPEFPIFEINENSGLLLYRTKYLSILEEYKLFKIKVCVTDGEFEECAMITVVYLGGKPITGNTISTKASPETINLIQLRAIQGESTVEIYNMMGQIVTHKLQYLTKGVYVCKIKTGNSVEVVKLVL